LGICRKHIRSVAGVWWTDKRNGKEEEIEKNYKIDPALHNTKKRKPLKRKRKGGGDNQNGRR